MFVNLYIEVKDHADAVELEFAIREHGHCFIDAGISEELENATLEQIEAAVCLGCRDRKRVKSV